MLATGMLVPGLLFLATPQAIPSPQHRHDPLPGPFSAGSEADVPFEDPGEALPDSAKGVGVVETLADVLAREAALPPGTDFNRRLRRGERGAWVTPSRASNQGLAKSGVQYVVNKWGDSRMGIGFAGEVDLEGVWVAGQGATTSWPEAIRVLGYRDGVLVSETEWWSHLGDSPVAWPLGLEGVDRIEFDLKPGATGAGWFALDDLTFVEKGAARPTVIDFEDLGPEAKLTGSGYQGLDWEEGQGEFIHDGIVPAPREESPRTPAVDPGAAGGGAAKGGADFGLGTTPQLISEFEGIRRGDAGQNSAPPDTCGAIGPDHFVEAVNLTFGIYDKDTGNQLFLSSLASFMGTGSFIGDPRVAYDQHSDRWIVIASDFSSRVFIAVSTTSDPTGTWFKSNWVVSTGPDTGCFPDYPTLGVNEDGIYVTAYMVGCGMSIFALEKAPLIAGSPSFGVITAWRGFSFQGAIQPCHVYGTPGVEYLISVWTNSSLRIRRISGALTSPTLSTLGNVSVLGGGDPPDSPVMGSIPLDSVGNRLMNAVFRDGNIYTTHNVNSGGIGVVRWYEIDAASQTVVDQGTISDNSIHFNMPSIAVNKNGDIVVGFSGSDASIFGSAYYAGRLDGDPAGEMSDPVLLQAGKASHSIIDSFGRNRWGDYSLTMLDPEDETTIWTIQEYVEAQDIWGTWIGELAWGTGGNPATYCTGKITSNGNLATIGSTGSPSFATNNFAVTGFSGLPGKNGIVFYGSNSNSQPFLGGTLCVATPLTRGPVFAFDPFGLHSEPVPIGVLDIGLTRYYQVWFRDPAQPDGTSVGLTDGLMVTFEP